MTALIDYVALLRGINVGGKNSVSMADLKADFEALNFTNVRSYINSGNLLFQSAIADPAVLERLIEVAIARHFSVPIKVMVRSAAAIATIISHLPESWQHPADKRCNVIFLSRSIDTPMIVNEFHPKPLIEELHYVPGALLWSANLDTLTRSTMLKVSSSPLYANMTIRGLNTTRRLHALLQ